MISVDIDQNSNSKPVEIFTVFVSDDYGSSVDLYHFRSMAEAENHLRRLRSLIAGQRLINKSDEFEIDLPDKIVYDGYIATITTGHIDLP